MSKNNEISALAEGKAGKMENKENVISYKRCAFLKEVVSDVGCDFTLPDYLGDIKRIVMTQEQLSTGGAYFEAGQIFGSGVVSYNVIYVDSEGKLTSAEFSKEYECCARCDKDTLSDTLLTSRIVNSGVRATTPRKLVAKSTVASSLRGFSDEAIIIPEDLTGGKLEFKDEVTSVRTTSITHLAEREYAERLCMLEGVMADDLTIVTRSARPEIKSVVAEGGMFVVRGEVRVECAVMCAPLAPTVHTLMLEINEECPLKCKDAISLCAIPNVSSLTVNAQPTDDGCEVLCDLILEITVVEDENLVVSLPSDAYAPGKEADLEYNTVTLESVVGAMNETKKCEMRIGREELGLADARDIIITDATVRTDPARMDGDTLFLTGEIKYAGAATQVSEDGALNYVSFKKTVPYEHIVNNTCQNSGNITYDIHTTVSDVCCMIDKGEAVLSCILDFKGIAVSERPYSYICSVDIRETDKQRAPRKIVVYYPDKEESLYEVAKRFDTTSFAVANINSLGVDVATTPAQKGGLSGIKRLIIY